MLTYFRLDSFDPTLNRIFLTDLHGDDGAWFHIAEPGDLFFLLEEHPNVVVGARTDPQQSWQVRLRDLRFHSACEDDPKHLGPCFFQLPGYDSTAAKPRFSRFINDVPRSTRTASHRSVAVSAESEKPPIIPPVAPAQQAAPVVPLHAARTPPEISPAPARSRWTGVLRRVAGFHR